ncbi:MAG: NADH-quinone oxidoreductase subunit N [Opitutaceae bacterium]|nr:NADH-quinone oxidoreductase subunit N [Opitutaceae bacterium]
MNPTVISFAPEIGYVACALLAIALDLAVGRKQSLEGRASLARNVGRFSVAIAFSTALFREPFVGQAALYFVADGVSAFTRFGVALLFWLCLETSAGTRPQSKPAETLALALFAVTGLSLLGAANHLLSGFLCLELAGLSLYALVGLDRRRPLAVEAALKYFLFGAMSAAFLLFGFSFVYGLTGSLGFEGIADSLVSPASLGLALLATVLILVGAAYKLAAAPCHFWAPDVYEAAHPFAASLVASASKVGGLVFFVRLFSTAFEPLSAGAHAGWSTAVAVLAAVSLILGNVVALSQTNVRRLLAYSAIGHAGALLLGLMVSRGAGAGPVLYYVLTYGIATVVLFGAVGVLERANDGRLLLGDLVGLSKHSPFIAICMAVSVLSLAGIPPLAGFLGKFFVFAEALRAGGVGSVSGMVACLAIAMSAVGLFYYLRILKESWVTPLPNAAEPQAVDLPTGVSVALGFGTALLIALGIAPGVLLGLLGS